MLDGCSAGAARSAFAVDWLRCLRRAGLVDLGGVDRGRLLGRLTRAAASGAGQDVLINFDPARDILRFEALIDGDGDNFSSSRASATSLANTPNG